MRIIGEIPRIDAADGARIREHVARSKPAVISGAAADWPIRRNWTREALLDRLGGAEVRYRLSPTDTHPAIDADGRLLRLEDQQGTLGDYLLRMAGTPNVFLDANLVCLASRRGKANPDLAPLLTDVVRPDFLDEAGIDTIGIWLSGRGVRTRLHYDRNGRHNFNAQLAGRKEVVLVPPGEFPKLYPFPISEPIYNFTRVGNYDPDPDAFPLFAEATGYRGILDQGDLLFIPAFWYHALTHVGDFNFNLNFWCDAHDVPMSSVALRNEMAILCRASGLTDGPGWEALSRRIDRQCLDWSPRRATSDEMKDARTATGLVNPPPEDAG